MKKLLVLANYLDNKHFNKESLNIETLKLLTNIHQIRDNFIFTENKSNIDLLHILQSINHQIKKYANKA